MQHDTEAAKDNAAFWALRDSTDSFLRKQCQPNNASDGAVAAATAAAAPAVDQTCTTGKVCTEVEAEAKMGSVSDVEGGKCAASKQLQGAEQAGDRASLQPLQGASDVSSTARSGRTSGAAHSAQSHASCNATVGACVEDSPELVKGSDGAASLDAWKLTATKQRRDNEIVDCSNSVGSGLITTAVVHHRRSESDSAECADNASLHSNDPARHVASRVPQASEPPPAGMESLTEAAQSAQLRALHDQMLALAPARITSRPDAVAADVGVERYLGMAQAAHPPVAESELAAHALRLAVEDRLLVRMCVTNGQTVLVHDAVLRCSVTVRSVASCVCCVSGLMLWLCSAV